MFYKQIGEEWHEANEVHFPDGDKIKKKDKRTRDGWKWSKKPPKEYLDYIESITAPNNID